MPVADPYHDTGGGGGPKKPKPPKSITRPTTPLTHLLGSPTSSGSSGGSSGGGGINYYQVPQPVYKAPTLRKKTGPYTMNEAAWGASAFPKQSAVLAKILPRLRTQLADEPAFNSFLSQLMTDRYDIFEDRLDRKFDHQKTQYQIELKRNLAAQDEGLPYEIPPLPELPEIPRGQGVGNLLRTLSNSVNPNMSDERTDAFSNFYRYELERLMDYKQDIRGQRESLRGYRQQALVDSRGQEAGDEIEGTGPDSDEDSPNSPAVGNSKLGKNPIGSVSGNANAAFSASSDDDGGGASNFIGGLLGKTSQPFDSILDGVQSVHKRIWDEAEDPLFWTFDKLSRPLYGVNNAGMAWFGEDKDPDSQKLSLLDHTGGGLAGKSITDTFDEFFSDPLGVGGEVLSEFGQGFSGKDKTMFGQVIARNAEADGVNDHRDNKYWQGIAGFAGDVTIDPINAIGIGIIAKPVQAFKQIENHREVMDIARKSSELLNRADEQVYSGVYDPTTKKHVPAEGPLEKPLSPKEIYALMAGTGNRNVASGAAKSHNLAETNYRLQRLMYRLDNADYSVDESAIASLGQMGKVLRDQREAVLKDFEGSTVVDSLRRDLKIKIAKGTEPAGAMEEFEALITSTYLEQKLIQANQYHKYLDDMATKEFGVTKSVERIEDNKTGRRRSVAADQVVSNEVGKQGNAAEGIGGVDRHYVDEGGTEVRKGTKRTRRAWENVERQYASKKSLNAKETDPKVKAQREVELTDMKTRIDRVLNDAADEYGGKLSDIAPELVRDYRVTPEQVDNLLTEAYAAAYDNPRFRKLTKDSMGINVQRKHGHNASVRASAATRWDFVNRQKNRILGDVATKILKSYFAGQEPVKNVGRVKEIRDELKRLEKQHGVPKADSKHEPILDKWGDENDRLYRQQLEEELRSLKGYPESGTKRSLTDIPYEFMSDGEFDINKLKNYIHVDSRAGKVNGEPNAFFGMFRPKQSIEKMDPIAHKWLMDMRMVLQDRYEPLFDEAYAPVRDAKRKLREQGATAGQKLNENFGKYTREAAIRAEAQAFDSIKRDIGLGRLETIDYADEVPVKYLSTDSPEQDLMDALKYKFTEQEAALKLQKYVAQRSKQDDEVAHLNSQLIGLREKWAKERTRQERIVKESKEASKLMSKRMHEEALLTAAQLAVGSSKNMLNLRVIGKDLTIPHSDMLFKGVEKMSGLPLAKQARQAYTAAFKPPSSFLPEDMKLASARALGETPIIIEHHVNKLRATLGQIPENQRVRAWDTILKGQGNILGEQPVQDAITSAFDDLLPFFKGYDMGVAGRLSIADINAYLPEEFRLNIGYVNKNGIDTTQHLMNAIRSNKTVKKSDRNQLKDPYRVSWALRIGVEQAQAKKALDHTINSVFGVKDLRTVGGHKDIGELNAEFKKLGWNTVPKLGGTHLFPPEVIPDINRLLDMMEPRNIHAVGRMMDHVTGYWKTMSTIYNPGYWTRNGIGEVMSGWLGGVNHPKWYNNSFNGVIKYARGDGMELDALTKQFPMLNHVKSESVPGKRKVAQLKDGTPISAEEAWVLYNDQGLKTGFINTEFDAQFSRLGDTLRSTPGTQSMANMHNKLRSTGEWYEDGLRVAHFLHAMENSGAKTLEAAASYAAKEVKKYHFDYTDFTNFEKTVMLRAFPFYKWTRKSLPLMATMLFTKPGKMLAYPKAMNSAQNTITSQDIAEDDNGFAPNYGELVPGWMQDMWAYQIAGHEAMGEEATYMNVATPQLDSLKFMNNPGSGGYGLLSPLIKLPAEIGQTVAGHGDEQSFLKDILGSDTLNFGNNEKMDIGLQTEEQDMSDSILTQLLRTTPQGNFGVKTGISDGEEGLTVPTDEEFVSFGTGLSTLLNNDDRRVGVLSSRPKAK